MDAINQLKEDVREGRIDADRLLDLVVTLQRQLESAKRELESAKQRIEELEKQVSGSGTLAPATAKVDEAFSLRAEEKRQDKHKKKRKRSKKGRRGRLTSAAKVKLAERTEKVFPQGVPQQDCHLS